MDSRFVTFRSKLMGDWGTSLEGKKGVSTKEYLKIVQLKDAYLLNLLLWLNLVKMRYLAHK